MKEAFVGFDPAWSVGNKGAICYVIYQHGNPVKTFLPHIADFDDAAGIVRELRQECDDVLVAIDQPIIVPNRYGGRPVDHVVDGVMDTLGSRGQLAYRNKENFFGDDSPIWKFMSKIGLCEYFGGTDLVDAHALVNFEDAKTPNGNTHAIEVYPALTLSSLDPKFINRNRAARYDPSKRSFKLRDWRRVCQIVAKCAKDLGIRELSRWGAEMRLGWDHPDKPQKSHQDKIDAAICLIIALQWRCQTDGICVIGDLQTGYIVTPTSDKIQEILRPACDSLGVCFNSAENYDQHYRLERSHVPTFGELLLEIPQDDQEFQRLPMSNRPLNL